MRILFATVMLLLVGAVPAVANYIQIENVHIHERGAGYAIIQFDLSWENSWRTNILNDPDNPSSQCPIRNNWDAAWIFIKWRLSSDAPQGIQPPTVAFSHAYLASTGHTIPTNSGSGVSVYTHAMGRVDERVAHNNDPNSGAFNPNVGMFIHANTHGSGHVQLNGVRIRWDYEETTDLVAEDQIDIRVFGIEMVMVPEGPFWVGDGDTRENIINNNLHRADDNSIPFYIDSEDEITLGGTHPNNLGNNNNTNPSSRDDFDETTIRTLPAGFPKGYAGFYMMKYKVTQGVWVDMLNTLTSTQASNLHIEVSTNRQAVSYSNGVYVTDKPYIVLQFPTFERNLAFHEWAGLRAITELEYEKAARGPLYPVPGEYAWGTPFRLSVPSSSLFVNRGKYNEHISGTTYSSSETHGSYTRSFPLRVGGFATSTSNRVQSGASYWGILDLNSHGFVRSYSVGRSGSRSFIPIHGTGVLDEDGKFTQNWPGAIGTTGCGHRGSTHRVSSRRWASSSSGTGTNSGRVIQGGRSLPANN